MILGNVLLSSRFSRIGGCLVMMGLCPPVAQAEVIINGQSYSGDKVMIENGTIHIDGTLVKQQAEGPITVIINGTLEQLRSDRGVVVEGDIQGDVDAAGSVRAEQIRGNVTGSGTVKADTIQGHVKVKGSVRAGTISGDVNATGSVRCQ